MSEEKEEKPKPHPLQRAWAAGVFDSRSSIPKNGYQLKIESYDESLIKRFYETVQIGANGVRGHGQANKQIYYVWTRNMDEARDLILLMSPFLSPQMKKKAAQMVARIERNATWRKNNPEKASSLVTSPVQTADQ